MMRKGYILSNIRIVEVGEGRVGPWAGLLLRDLGAEIIKVESITRPDMTRGVTRISFPASPTGAALAPDYPDGIPGERHWNRCCEFTARNQGKLGITLDLAKPQGLEVFLRLIKVSDAFYSNMAVGAAEKLCITYADLVKVNPNIIYLSSTGYGRQGPYALQVAMGSTIDAAAGIFGLRDYGDGDSTAVSPDTHCDSIGALSNALGLIFALYHRQKTGKGIYIDSSMVEPSMTHIGEAIMDYTMNGRVWRSLGNRDMTMSPQGCYPCQGKDQWVTFSIASDKEWQKLIRVMGMPKLAKDERFANPLARLKHQDELDELIKAWTAPRTKFEVTELLQKAGIAAGAVLDSADVYKDPDAQAREFFETVDQPDVGKRALPGRLWKLGDTEVPGREHAPTLGEHNDYVLKEIIGLTSEEVAKLERDQIIGTVPISL
ncbi:MAG: CoA transferase [Chloroflexi bacterium]|nr:CoA transferase [Chloroflexota bacterium]